MKPCPCTAATLISAYTKQGVEIDICPSCRGIWLDRDEIYLFTRRPHDLRSKLNEALRNKKSSARLSPITGHPMVELLLEDSGVVIDYCEESGGIWFDEGELERLPVETALIEIDHGVGGIERPVPGATALSDRLLPLPNLALASGSVLFGMYAILTFLLILAVEFTGLTPALALIIGAASAAVHFLIGPFMMDLMLRWLYRIHWVEPGGLPEHLRHFTEQVCGRHQIKFPRFGVIPDGAPQAFTYGHHPDNARIVLSQGLMDLLTPEETEAVVAHEIGHAVHWDMLIMTIAQLVPLVLYYLYRTLIRMKSSGRQDKSAGARIAAAVIVYVFYIISEYTVLWFSRVREYYADRFAGEETRHPAHLASALVKIGYGLAGRKPEGVENEKGRSQLMNGVQSLGIFDKRQANALALSSGCHAVSMGGDIDREALKEVAKWDLWNPWAMYYEIHSTHPLIAKRLMMLGQQARVLGQPPYVEFDERKPESYWDDFLLDVIVSSLPMITVVAGLFVMAGHISAVFFRGAPLCGFCHQTKAGGLFFLFLGISFLVKTLYMYSSTHFMPMTIQGLLKKIKVSAVNPAACVVRGKIIGRGVPGLIYSEDFVLQDKTGIIFLDYQQPLAVWNFLFGLFRAAHYQNQEAEIVGWYRRSPIPYIEVKSMTVNGKTSVCYVYHLKIISALAVLALGVFLLLMM